MKMMSGENNKMVTRCTVDVLIGVGYKDTTSFYLAGGMWSFDTMHDFS